jgi:hypothetical protein
MYHDHFYQKNVEVMLYPFVQDDRTKNFTFITKHNYEFVSCD